MTSRSPRWIVPSSGSCSVARMRISVDLPAPLRPSNPNIPGGTSREIPFNARVPFGYVFESPEMESVMDVRLRENARGCCGGGENYADLQGAGGASGDFSPT